MGRNYLRFLVNFYYGLIINTMQISFVSVFWQFFQDNQEVKSVTEKRENEVDFTLEKCSGEFYNFLANFLPHSYVHYTVLQNLSNDQKCQLPSGIKISSFPTILRVTKNNPITCSNIITIRVIWGLRDWSTTKPKVEKRMFWLMESKEGWQQSHWNDRGAAWPQQQVELEIYCLDLPSCLCSSLCVCFILSS